MKKPTANQLVEEIVKQKGNISAIARAFGRPRSTVYTWIDSYASAKQALKDQRELVVDVAENRLFAKMTDGDNQAIFYILNNMKEARDRGWGSMQHHDHTSGGEKIQPLIYLPDNGRQLGESNDD